MTNIFALKDLPNIVMGVSMVTTPYVLLARQRKIWPLMSNVCDSNSICRLNDSIDPLL